MEALDSVSGHIHHRHCVLSTFVDCHEAAKHLIVRLSGVRGEGCLDLLTVSL